MLKPSGRWADLINDLIGDEPTPDASCEHCLKEFVSRSKTQRFCSHSCRQMAWLKATKPPLEPFQCACGVTIPHSGVGPRRKTCSDECRRKRLK